MPTALDMPAGAATRACPFCEGVILAKALQCSLCRKWLPDAFAAAQTEEVVVQVESATSRGQTLGHLVLLTVFTGGLYALYWFYRNWCDLDEVSDGDEAANTPALLTLGLLVPLLNIILVYRQFERIRAALVEKGVPAGYSPLLTTSLYFGIAILTNLTALWTLSLLMVVPLLPVQDALNRYWSTQEPPGVVVRESLSRTEVAVIACGALVMLGAMMARSAILQTP